MLCSYCNKKFNSLHSKNSHKPRCKEFQKYNYKQSKLINKKMFLKLYTQKEYSLYELSLYFNVTGNVIEQKFKEFNILKRKNRYTTRRNNKMKIKKQNYTEEENKRINNKRKETCFKKYNVDNVRKSPKIKEKVYNTKLKNIDKFGLNSFENASIRRKKTCLEKYGVDNFFKTKEFRKSIRSKLDYKKIMEKGFKTKIEKYGTPFTFTLNKSNGKRLSKPVIKIKKLLNSLNIKFIMDYYIPNTRYYVDFFIKDLNIIIEVNGDYWHANPIRYKFRHKFNFHGNKTTAQNIWDYDFKRNNKLKSLGYNLLIIWEKDINEDFKNIRKLVKNLIKRQNIFRKVLTKIFGVK